MKVLGTETAGSPSATELRVATCVGDIWTDRVDSVAIEEPLEIRLAGCRVAVTMRTPGDDFDLAVGFLLTEGIVREPRDIASVSRCRDDGAGAGDSNIVNVNPSDPAIVDPSRWQRNFFATSSCGLCGKATIEAIRQEAAPVTSQARVAHDTLYELGARLRSAQTVFSQTGGLHGAALFDVQGNLITLREDVGRHNAVDKVIGDAVRRGCVPLSDRILMVSGRASFEITQKAVMAGIPIVVAVSAPSSLAVDLARSAGVTLVGFLRSDRGSGRFNVYSGAERILDSRTEWEA